MVKVKEFSFLEIYNMTNKERKQKRVSSELRENDIGLIIATWCQVVDGFYVIKQAVADVECKHFTNGHGMENTIFIKDLSFLRI